MTGQMLERDKGWTEGDWLTLLHCTGMKTQSGMLLGNLSLIQIGTDSNSKVNIKRKGEQANTQTSTSDIF